MITNILNEMKMMYGWSDATYKQYEQMLRHYCSFCEATFTELLQEAEEDEENIPKINKRRIKRRLMSYTIHLRESKRTDSTVHNYLTKIKHIYRYQEIEIPTLPPLKVEYNEGYADLPTRDEITRAVEYSNIKMKAVITFLASTGLRRSDMCALTVRDFVDATREYHQVVNDDLREIIRVLSLQRDVIPCWSIVSVKTGVSHVTFCSPEACSFVVQMLRERLLEKDVSLDDSLFDLRVKSVTQNFARMNDRLGFGWKEHRRKFHPHALRSFFATTLTSNDVDYLATEFLLGHKLKKVQSSYYYANPEKLRLKYSRVVDELCFVTRVHNVDIVSAEHRELSRLRDENRETRERLYELEEMIDSLRSLQRE